MGLCKLLTSVLYPSHCSVPARFQTFLGGFRARNVPHIGRAKHFHCPEKALSLLAGQRAFLPAVSLLNHQRLLLSHTLK